MLRLIPAIAVLAFTPALASPPALASEQRSGVERLREVSVIYVAELGPTWRAKTLRQEIIKEFAKSDFVRVVDSPEKADAVLTATFKQVSKNVDHPSEVFGEPGMKSGSSVVTALQIQFRVDSRQHRNLWKAKFEPDSSSSMNESQAVQALANRVSRTFQKAIEKDSKKRR
jgi:hypothetical protein